MARAMAAEGGIGIIHRGMSIQAQVEAVIQVKRSQSAVIRDPLTLPVDATIGEATACASKNGVTSLLITDKVDSNKLVGVLSKRDMPWDRAQDAEPVSNFMTPLAKLVTAAPDITGEEAMDLLFKTRLERLPLIDDDSQVRGLITRKDILSARDRPYASKDENGHLLVGAAIGAHGDYLDRATALLEAGADCLFVDIAHGHSVVMEGALKALRQNFDSAPIVAGNVATGDGARFLRDLGADAIKVGVGSGHGCRTRLETAAGIPQLQAIVEARDAIGADVPIVADGGIKTDKDIFLALICGASTVMLGSALSGTDEAPGRVITDPVKGTKKKVYRGMTSPQAVLDSLYETHTENEIDEVLSVPAEGQETQVDYKGNVADILNRIRGHLKSAVSYGGEESLMSIKSSVETDPSRFLIPLSQASRRESYDR
jgi:IMP dehydrogenase